MSFLSKIFRSKKKIETIEITLDSLPEMIHKNFENKIKILEMESAKELTKLKFSFEKAKILLKEIKQKEIIKKENNRLNKAAMTSKNQIEKQLERMLDKIDPKETSTELDEIRAYSNESYVLLVNEINSFRKNIAYTSVFLKEEMKQLGETLQEILNSLNKIRTDLEKEKDVFKFEKINKKIDEIKKINEEIKKIDEKTQQINEEIKEQENKKIEITKKIIELKESDSAKELSVLEEAKSKISNEKQKIKIEISSILSTIDRPLQRFNSLIESGRWSISSEKKQLLNNFITNPLLALKKDVNGAEFKEILKEIIKAIEDNKIELKDKEKEKRLDALNELIHFSFFEKVFWKLNEIQKEQINIEIQIKNNSINKELIHENDLLNETEKTIKKMKKETEIEQSKLEKLNQIKQDEEQIIKQFTEKITNKKIILIYN